MSIELTHKLRMIATGIYMFYCPGCGCNHIVPTHGCDEKDTNITARWTYNNDHVSPSFMPSIHITATGDWEDNGIVYKKTLCHMYVDSGVLRYLSDCDHELAGMTVSMVKFPDWNAV